MLSTSSERALGMHQGLVLAGHLGAAIRSEVTVSGCWRWPSCRVRFAVQGNEWFNVVVTQLEISMCNVLQETVLGGSALRVCGR